MSVPVGGPVDRDLPRCAFSFLSLFFSSSAQCFCAVPGRPAPDCRVSFPPVSD